MRFGTKYDDFNKQSSGGGGGTFIRAFKEGDTEVHFLTESSEWVGYIEHYNPNPGGFSFPCTGESDCPGCNSSLEKMKSKSRKVAIPCLVEDKWVNVYKVPKKFAERLAKRGERFNTMLDRTYVITRTGTSTDTDYDIESGDKDRVPFRAEAYDIPDIEQLLQDNWNQVWGDEVAEPVRKAVKKARDKRDDSDGDEHFTSEGRLKQPKSTDNSGDVEITESAMRAMRASDLLELLDAQGEDMPPHILEATDTNEIVNWLMKVKVPF